MPEIFLSVIVPAFNEEKNIGKGKIKHLLEYLDSQPYSYELIFVDDGSTDRTLGRLRKLEQKHERVRVIANSHQGKALTVIAGLQKGRGKYRLFTDFDQSTPISEVEKLLPYVDKDYEIVIGSREIEGARREDEPWYRHIMGKVFNLVVKTFTVRGIRDTQCGFKMLSEESIKVLLPQLRVTNQAKTRAFTGAFDVELLYLAQKQGFKIAEVPVNWKHEATTRVSPVKDSVMMFWEVVKIRWTDIAGGYKKKA